MRIAAIGTPNRLKELEEIISSKHDVIETKNNNFKDIDLVIDLNFDDHPSRIIDYVNLKGVPVILGAVKCQIEQVLSDHPLVHSGLFYGMNTLPTFINRPIIEMCSLVEEDRSTFEPFRELLDWDVSWVDSRVGMVTPRVICMIINEAYFTLQEGTASMEDINTGMKLGTAYPFGPFEWSDKIGIKNVYEVLLAMKKDTGDGRYKICPALRKAYYASRTSK